MAAGQADGEIDLSSRITLSRLIDLAAQRVAGEISYNAPELDRISIALRTQGAMTPQALWELTNQLLAENGYTTVRLPGARTFSVVRLTDAGAQARLEDAVGADESPGAGFEARLVEVRNRSAKELSEAVKLVLSKGTSSVSTVGGDRQLLIADLRPRIDQATWLIDQLDVPGDPPIVRRLAAKHLPATQLVAMVNSAVEAQRPLRTRQLLGSLKAAIGGDSGAMLLVAPEDEVDGFLRLIDELDQQAPVSTVAYPVPGFELGEVASLVETTDRDNGPTGSGDRWRVVTDDLTGSLVISATASEHERIDATLQRLGRLPSEQRQSTRTYAIRNRSVEEVVELLGQLVSSGVLSAETSLEPSASFDAAAGSQTIIRPPPAGLEPTTPAPPNAAGAPPSRSASSGARQGARRTGTSEGRPPLSLTADKGTNTLIARGDAKVLRQLEEILATLDVRQPQVMLEVLVVSLNDQQMLDLGVEIEKLITSGDTIIRLASLFGLSAAASPLVAGAVGSLPAAGQGGSALVLKPGDFDVLIRALQTLNNGKSLNIPKVLVNNNEQGTLDSVLEVPFLSTNASTTVATTSYGGSQSAGTTVTIKPTIAAGDHLRLEYVVTLSAFVGDSTDPSLPPPRQQNNLQSVISIPDGFTVAVGGIEIVTEGEAVKQVPFLGDVPILGEAFKSRSKQATRNRFFVFITADILRRQGFEDLRHISRTTLREAEVKGSLPHVRPQIVR